MTLKSPILRDRAYLDYLRTQPCLLTGRLATDADAVEAAHIGTLGKGIKSPDNEAIPLSHSIHRECHQRGEISTLRRLMPDWLLRECLRAYAREMYAEWENGNDGTDDRVYTTR